LWVTGDLAAGNFENRKQVEVGVLVVVIMTVERALRRPAIDPSEKNVLLFSRRPPEPQAPQDLLASARSLSNHPYVEP